MKKNRLSWFATALIWATGAFSVSTHAGVSSISAGVSANIPLGDNSITLNQPAGVELRAQLPVALFGSTPNLLQISGTFQPYTVTNMGNGKLNMIGGYVGLTTLTENTPNFLNPFISADIGAVYEYLSLSGVSNTVQNTALGFSARVVPGVDIPVVGGFGIRAETPITGTWFKTSFYAWSTLFSIRWKL